MQAAPELEALIARLYQAMAGGDFQFLQEVFSPQPQTLVIGTDPEEWWEGGAEFVQAMRRRMETIRTGIPIVASDPRAFKEENTGWAADRGAYELPSGVRQPFRSSFVFLRRENTWQIAQWHVSFPVPNEAALAGDQ